MKTDVLSKIKEIILVAKAKPFASAGDFAQYLHDAALETEGNSPFNLPGVRGGNAATVTSVLTIEKHVEFCHLLHLITFHDEASFLPYEPLAAEGLKLHAVIAEELWKYLDREGISRSELKSAMKKTQIHDPMSIWGKFPVRRISRGNFRKCIYLLAQVSPDLMINRKWTYHFSADLTVF
jgi:hypothetical protein